MPFIRGNKTERGLLEWLLNTIGDAGDTPEDKAGYTILRWLNDVFVESAGVHSKIKQPGDAELLTTTPLAANATYTEPIIDFTF